jgi:hypothetical protein
MPMDELEELDDEVVLPPTSNKTKLIPLDKSLHRTQLLKNKTEFLHKYLNKLMEIINAMYSKNKKEPEIIELRDKFLVAKKEVPEKIINDTGPYLWTYREQIKKREIKKLLENDFQEEIGQYKETIPSMEKFEKIPHLINQIKRTWHLFTSAEQNAMFTLLQELTGYYASYVGICRELKKLNNLDS